MDEKYDEMLSQDLKDQMEKERQEQEEVQRKNDLAFAISQEFPKTDITVAYQKLEQAAWNVDAVRSDL